MKLSRLSRPLYGPAKRCTVVKIFNEKKCRFKNILFHHWFHNAIEVLNFLLYFLSCPLTILTLACAYHIIRISKRHAIRFLVPLFNASRSTAIWIAAYCRSTQGRREGVKGVTVSRGPALKRGPGDHENKRKLG